MDSKDECEPPKNAALELSTALEAACRAGNILEVKRLLDNGAPLSNCSNCNGIDALTIAIYNNHVDICALLVDYFPSKAFAEGIHLCQACEVGNLKIVSLLLNSQKSSKPRYILTIDPLLVLACRFGHLDIAALLIQNSARVHARSLHEAIIRNDLAMLKLLLKRGGHKVVNEFEVRTRQDEGFQPLLVTACQMGQLPLVKLLIENGAHGRLPSVNAHLVLAANQGCRDIVLYLLQQPNVILDFTNKSFHQGGINLVVATLLELGINIVNKCHLFGNGRLDLELLMELDVYQLGGNSMPMIDTILLHASPFSIEEGKKGKVELFMEAGLDATGFGRSSYRANLGRLLLLLEDMGWLYDLDSTISVSEESQQKSQRELLATACKLQAIELAERLHQRGVILPLLVSIAFVTRGGFPALEFLTARGYNPFELAFLNAINGTNILMLVCQDLQVDSLRLLLSFPKAVTVINKQDKSKQTVFHYTVLTSSEVKEEDAIFEVKTNKRIEIIRLLLAADGDPSLCNAYDMSGADFFIRYMFMAEGQLGRALDWPREEMQAAARQSR